MRSDFWIKSIGGVLVLLVINLVVFTGKMAPAMWELTSIIWVLLCLSSDEKQGERDDG